ASHPPRGKPLDRKRSSPQIFLTRFASLGRFALPEINLWPTTPTNVQNIQFLKIPHQNSLISTRLNYQAHFEIPYSL
ncbi:hypothetical protein ACMB91_003885, partial [Escherichia coli]